MYCEKGKCNILLCSEISNHCISAQEAIAGIWVSPSLQPTKCRSPVILIQRAGRIRLTRAGWRFSSTQLVLNIWDSSPEREVLKSRWTRLVIWFSLLIIDLIGVGIHQVLFLKKPNNLSFAKIKNVPDFLHASVKSPWVYNLLQKGTSVSNSWSSAFVMDDSNELNSFVSHSVVDYKFIRNPFSPPLDLSCISCPLWIFFSWSQSKSWIFSGSQAVINEQLPHRRDLSAIFLECTHGTNPPWPGFRDAGYLLGCS